MSTIRNAKAARNTRAAKTYTTAEAVALAVKESHAFNGKGGFSFSFRADKIILRGPAGAIHRTLEQFLTTYAAQTWKLA